MRRRHLFFLIVFALIIIFISGSAFAAAMGWIESLERADVFLADADNRWGVGAVSAFLLLLALWSLVDLLRTPKERDLVIHESGLGSVEISSVALESMIRRAARDVRDVRDVQPVLRTDQNGLVVMLRMSVSPDATLPEISQDVQQTVQENLEKKAGVHVSSVQVLIRSVTADMRPRVE
jgi:uncharacterized alkaline shock family protein YloU